MSVEKHQRVVLSDGVYNNPPNAPLGTWQNPFYAAAKPYPYSPCPSNQYNLVCSTAGPAGLSFLTPPVAAIAATVQAVGASVNYTTDGATVPTGSLGMTLAAGASVFLQGTAVLAVVNFYSATGKINVEYFQ